MKDKLQYLMKDAGLTSSRLAEILEVQPSGISHILSGRNKPSFELLQKILRRFPHINPDWLLLDSEKMYRNDDELDSVHSATQSKIGEGLFAETESPASTNIATDKNPPTQTPDTNLQPHSASQFANLGLNAKVKRVVVVFDDNTFETYSPRE